MSKCFHPDIKLLDVDGDGLQVGGHVLECTNVPVVVLQPRHFAFCGGTALHLPLDEAERLAHHILAAVAAGKALPCAH